MKDKQKTKLIATIHIHVRKDILRNGTNNSKDIRE